MSVMHFRRTINAKRPINVCRLSVPIMGKAHSNATAGCATRSFFDLDVRTGDESAVRAE